MSLIVDNVLDLIELFGEEETKQDLNSFSCPLNPEIEQFLVNDAIEFAKRKMSVTYIVSDSEDGSILGYFTLANKALEIKESAVSKNLAKKVSRYGILDENEGTYTVHSYLLAQFGKNFAVEGGRKIHASDLMAQVDAVIRQIQHLIGGGLIYLDVEKTDLPGKRYEKLVDLYRKTSNYVTFSERHSSTDGKDYVMMIKAV